MKRKIFISLGVLGIILAGYIFLSFALSGFNYKVFLGLEERRLDSITYQENVNNLNVSIASDNLISKKSEDDTVRISYYQSNIYDYKISLENGTLTISQKKPWYIMFSFTKAKDIEITLPESLISARLKLASGTIDITSGINIEELSVQASSGEIILKDLTAETAEIKVSSGSVNITNMETENLKISASSGNINLKKVDAEEADLSLSSGNVNLDDSSLINLDIDASSGKITSTKLRSENCEVLASSGTVNLGILTSDPELYQLDLKTSSGKINVKGTGTDISSQGILKFGNGPNLIKVSVSSGNITIKFENA